MPMLRKGSKTQTAGEWLEFGWMNESGQRRLGSVMAVNLIEQEKKLYAVSL